VDQEVAEVQSLKATTARLGDLLAPSVRRVLLIGVTLAVLQQVTGINTVISYLPTLLKDAGLGSSASLLANVGNGAVDVGFTILAIVLIDRVGRRPLLVTGLVGMTLGLAGGTGVFTGGTHLHGASATVAIAAFFFYTASFAIGLGPVFWLLISEIYPVDIRGEAMGVATMANWGANLVVTISFLTLLSAIHGEGTFLLFAALSLAAVIYSLLRVPETKGRPLEAIERDLE